MPVITPGKAGQTISKLYAISKMEIAYGVIPLSGRIIGLFRLSYLTPGLMCAGVTEVIGEKEQEDEEEKEEKRGKKDDEDRRKKK